MKTLTRYLYVSIIITIFVWCINLLLGGWNGIEQELKDFAMDFLFSFSLTTVNSYYFNILGNYYSWSKDGLKRLFAGAIGSVVLTMITLFILFFISRVFIYGMSIDAFFENQAWEWYLFGLIITVIISIGFHAFYFWKELQKQKVKEQKVIASSATAQFDALKNQLDPHFLFNSLNVLVSLIEENPKAATKFTTSLSKVYRYVLEQRNKELVLVDEELKFARTYVGLLKWRFEDSLEVAIPEKATNPELKVVPLSLQLLLENAVKHNIVSGSQPLSLRIYEKDNELIVENNLQVKQHVKKGSGVGLQNIASRYGLLSSRKMSISQDEEIFKVQIPMLIDSEIRNTQNLEIMNDSTLEDPKLVHARERVASIKEFYDNLLRTGVILAFLATINYFTSDFPWVIFPAVGMSIGLLFNYFKTFNQNFFLGKGWEERKIQQYINDKDF